MTTGPLDSDDADLFVRLDRTFDVDKMRTDVERLSQTPWLPQPSAGYHDGDWTGISLYNRGGRMDSALATRPSPEPVLPTEALAHAPYLRTILEELPCPKGVVRLLALPPGAVIRRHEDVGVGFQSGLIRLHVPIVTHPDVLFCIGGRRCVWGPGELWYGDFSREHYVENHSDVRRVHLVVDAFVSEALLGLFPADLVARQRARGISLAPDDWGAPRATADLTRFVSHFTIPPKVVPYLMSGGRASVQLVDEALALCVEGVSVAALEPVGHDTLGIVGVPPGVVLEFGFAGSAVERVALLLRGFQHEIEAPGVTHRADGSTEIVFPLRPTDRSADRPPPAV